jgi:large subunit ribosomal protein L4
VAFPPIPRSYAFKVNKKVRAKAFRMALADLVQSGAVRVLAGASFDEPSTKRAAGFVEGASLERPLLLIAAPDELALLLSFRNLPGVRALPVGDVEVQDYVWAQSALITEAALPLLEGGEA